MKSKHKYLVGVIVLVLLSSSTNIKNKSSYDLPLLNKTSLHGSATQKNICDKCKLFIKDKIISANGRHFHPDCFRCDNCKKQLFSFILTPENNFFCKTCYERQFLPQCYHCDKTINGKYYIDEYDNNSHIHHDPQICHYCGIFVENLDHKKVKHQQNNHSLCSKCSSTIVHSDEQIMSSYTFVTQLLADKGFRNITTGIIVRLQSHDQLNGLLGQALTHSYYRDAFEFNYNEISILANLPKIIFEAVLAHELIHVWLSENEIHLKDYEEGFCNYGHYLVCKYYAGHPVAVRSLKTLEDGMDIEYHVRFREIKDLVSKVGSEKFILILNENKHL